MKTKILLLLCVVSFAFSTSIQGATPDLRKSTKTGLIKSETAAKNQLFSFQEITLIKINHQDFCDVALIVQEVNSPITYFPVKGISKFAKNYNSKAKKENDNKNYRKPRDKISYR